MDDQPALPRPTVNPWVVLVVGSLSAFMVFLDAQVLFVAFDDIRSSFPSVSFATMSWTLSAYTIALAAALVPAGRMADRYGRRRVFLIGLVAFTLASVLCAVAPSAGLLVAFRVIQALGAAALVPASLALVLSVFPPARVPVAVAVWGAIAALAAAVGPTAGALLVEAWDWRAVFLANVPVGAIALVLGIRLLPESREADRARFPDPLGIALLAGSLTLLALGIVQSDQWGWTAPATAGCPGGWSPGARRLRAADAVGAAPSPGPADLRQTVGALGEHRHGCFHDRVHRHVLRPDRREWGVPAHQAR